jgi:hypothetical protein
VVSIAFSSSKESVACNFRADAVNQAQIDNTPHASQTARTLMQMAVFDTCTKSGRDIEKACMKEGLIVNADTPNTTTSDTWHACHANRQVFDLCRQNFLISQHDTF